MARSSKSSTLGFLAYGAILINAIVWLLKCFNVNLGSFMGLLEGISSLILVFVALAVAYDFAKRQKTIWRIIFYILAIASICAILFGVGYNFVG